MVNRCLAVCLPMPALPVCAWLINGAIHYTQWLQWQRQQQQLLNLEEDFDPQVQDEAETASISSLSSLSLLSSFSLISSLEGQLGGSPMFKVMDIDGKLLWLDDEDDDGEDEEFTRHFESVKSYLTYLLTTCVLSSNNVHKFSQLHLILVLYKSDDTKHFCHNLRILPETFDELVTHICSHTIFASHGRPQLPVEA